MVVGDTDFLGTFDQNLSSNDHDLLEMAFPSKTYSIWGSYISRHNRDYGA